MARRRTSLPALGPVERELNLTGCRGLAVIFMFLLLLVPAGWVPGKFSKALEVGRFRGLRAFGYRAEMRLRDLRPLWQSRRTNALTVAQPLGSLWFEKA